MKKLLILMVVFSALIQINTIQACTAFLLKKNNSYVVGLNYDFQSNQGMIMINPSGILKESIPFLFEKPAKWT